jgi:hypothetical protein
VKISGKIRPTDRTSATFLLPQNTTLAVKQEFRGSRAKAQVAIRGSGGLLRLIKRHPSQTQARTGRNLMRHCEASISLGLDK